MPIKNFGLDIQCGECGSFMRILNKGKDSNETIVYECPKCKLKINVRMRLGLII